MKESYVFGDVIEWFGERYVVLSSYSKDSGKVILISDEGYLLEFHGSIKI